MEDKKDWQYGYELSYLLGIEKFYQPHNELVGSPFAKYKKNNIALDLHEKALHVCLDENEKIICAYVKKTSKVKSDIVMYEGVTIGTKQKGDVTITNLYSPDEHLLQDALTEQQQPTWFYCSAESETPNRIARECGYTRVGTKISTFSDLIAIHFKQGVGVQPRGFSLVDPVERIAMKKIGVIDKTLIVGIANRIAELNLDFKNHYSNYNKNESWSAISLRGYLPDIKFIEKPIAMSKKWHEQNKDKNFRLQDTELREKFPEVNELLEFIDGGIDRIRFMNLNPNQGELERHTDQVDPNLGGAPGKLARLHFPIITNDQVHFSVWNTDGKKQTDNMKIGELWYLDTRKPHTVLNAGATERIHLVVDCEVTEKIYQLLIR